MPRREPPRRIDQIEEGAFALRLVRQGPEVAAAIRRDPAGLWYGEINGQVFSGHTNPHRATEVSRIWETGRRVSWIEYGVLLINPPVAPHLPVRLGQSKVVF